MALLFTDGFDHYGADDFTKKWGASGTATNSITNVNARRLSGNNSAFATSTGANGFLSKTFGNAGVTLIIGFAFKIDSSPITARRLFSVLDSASVAHLTARINTDRTISILRGIVSGTLLSTTVDVIPLGTYTYIEFKCTINDTTGSYELRFNEVNVLSQSGIDTRNASLLNASGLIIGSDSGGGYTAYFDDLYVCDDTGSLNNNFLGDIKISTVFAETDGTTNNFIPILSDDNFRGVRTTKSKNIIQESEDFSNTTYWTTTNATVTSNAVDAPDGALTADRVTSTNSTTSRLIYDSFTTLLIPHVFSLYVKGETTTIGKTFTLGAVSAATNFNMTSVILTGAWQRVEITFTPVSTSAGQNDLYINLRDSAFNATDINSGESILIAWAQGEYASVATDYIRRTPTLFTQNNASDVVNDVDLYNFEAVNNTTILGVQVNALVDKSDAGTRTAANVIKSGATTLVKATYSPVTTTPIFYSNIQETDPNTSAAWTQSNLNAAEFGIKVIS